jgi:hypothetical protein
MLAGTRRTKITLEDANSCGILSYPLFVISTSALVLDNELKASDSQNDLSLASKIKNEILIDCLLICSRAIAANPSNPMINILRFHVPAFTIREPKGHHLSYQWLFHKDPATQRFEQAAYTMY